MFESKITNGEELPPFLSWLLKNLISIQIDNKHTWTGSIFNENTIIATAECAEDLIKYMNSNEKLPVPTLPKVCYGGPLTGTDYTCASVVAMDIQNEFSFIPNRSYRCEKPFLPYNYAFLKVSLFHAM